jgi:membrane protease YdiL (CAAX protease family)
MEATSSETSSAPSERSRVPGALLAWLGLTGLLVGLAFASQATTTESNDQIFFDYEFAVGSVVVYGLLVGLTFAIARLLPRPRADLALVRFAPRWAWTAVGIALAGIVVSAALEPLLHAGDEQGLTPERWESGRAPAFVLSSLAVVLVAPFAEELLYRGLGMRVLAFLGAPAAVVGTAAVFALSHGLVSALAPLGLFALGLGWLRLRSGSVWPAFLAHAAYNLTGVLVALYISLNPEQAAALDFLL